MVSKCIPMYPYSERQMEILHTERRCYEGGAERFANAGLEDKRNGAGATSQEILVASRSGQDKGSILP